MHDTLLAQNDILAYLRQHEQKELLRFITCGSVDDGKSTLIGRLLYDSKMVYEDQLAAVTADSRKYGTTGGGFDPALLTDGLRAEREQGITIDVAYRYFSTARRKFIIADTPGHEQYTRNMATGASTANLAIILIDARHGVQVQTRRHSFICSLLGIRHVVIAINKMDLVSYDQKVFEQIQQDYTQFVAKLNLPDVQFVPMSALAGVNVVHDAQKQMPWYSGPTLMHILENVHIASDHNLVDLRFPVQFVNRPNLDFRGFCGTLASGIVRPGDKVMALPSRKTSRVARIVAGNKDLEEAFAPQAVTLTLTDEIDVSRGDMLVHAHSLPRAERTFEAMLVWMNESALQPGRPYLIKHCTHTIPGVIREVHYRVNVNTTHREDAGALELNEIGRCVIDLSRSVAFDPYKNNRQTGSFIVIDRMTNNTVGAGMILESHPDQDRSGRDLTSKFGTDVQLQESLITPSQRARRFGHQPATVWLTGLTGSGKRAIAYALEERLFQLGCATQVLYGRNARLGLNIDLDFSPEDRAENLRRAGEVARLMNKAGLLCICAFLSPSEEDRAMVRQIVTRGEAARFFEVFLDAPPEICAKRTAQDPQRAEANRPFFSDSSPYQPPQSAELVLPTHELSADACVDRIVAMLEEAGILQVR